MRLKILVAEDFDGFREYVCEELRQRQEFEVTAVTDGLAAVRAAQELRPDLALLDIGLPVMNGLAAATQIRRDCPDTKIVFLTQESSPDIVEAALALGAHGYLLKSRTHSCLMPALDAILNRNAGAAPRRSQEPRPAGAPLAHYVFFHADEAMLIDSAERHVLSTLEAGDAAIVVLARPHLDALDGRFTRRHPSVARAVERGTLRLVDAADVLSSISHGADADAERVRAAFLELIASTGAATGRPHPRVAVFGEIGALTFASRQVAIEGRLEEIGRELVAGSTTPAVELTCVYPLLPTTDDASFTRICAAHSVIVVR